MTALIISLNFHPGHVSHMVASYKQCEKLGYELVYYVNPSFIPYLPKGSRIVSAVEGKHPKAGDLSLSKPKESTAHLETEATRN